MKRMSIVKKVILFIVVLFIISGIYGGGYFAFYNVINVKATGANINKAKTKADKNLLINNKISVANPEKNNSSSDKKVDDNSYPAKKVADIITGNDIKDGKKIAFLTFDDGPSTTITPKVLATLDKYGIKGTFFLIGKMVEASDESKALVSEIYKDGNSIGNHTYTHEYRIHVQNSLYFGNKIDIDRFFSEVEQTDNSISNAIGQTYKSKVIRMPGGHNSREYYHDPNLPLFDEKLKEKNLINIDWTVDDEDSDPDSKWKSSEQIFQEVKNGIGNNEKVVILMHDAYGKDETAKALPQIIEYLKAQGYEFKRIN